MARKPGRIRAGFGKLVLSVPFLRRRYLTRLLATLEEGRIGKRPLPPELQQLRKAIMRVPKRERLGTLDTALRQGPQLAQEPPSRALRRAAARQQRRSR